MSNVIPMPDGSHLVAAMKGPEQSGLSVIIEERVVPNLAMRETATDVVFVLDGRLTFGFPKAIAHQAAAFAANAMAIGAGFPCFAADHKCEAFAPKVAVIEP